MNTFAFNKLRPAAKFIEQMHNERCKQTKLRFPHLTWTRFFLFLFSSIFVSIVIVRIFTMVWCQFTEIYIVPLNLHLWGNYKIIFSLIFLLFGFAFFAVLQWHTKFNYNVSQWIRDNGRGNQYGWLLLILFYFVSFFNENSSFDLMIAEDSNNFFHTKKWLKQNESY